MTKGVVVTFPASKAAQLMGARNVCTGGVGGVGVGGGVGGGVSVGGVGEVSKGVEVGVAEFLRNLTHTELVSRSLLLEEKLVSVATQLRKLNLKYIRCRSELFEAIAGGEGDGGVAGKLSITELRKRVKYLNEV